MRKISALSKSLLSSEGASPFYMVRIEITPAMRTAGYSDIFDTTLNTPTTFNSELYAPNNALSLIEPPKLSEAVDRESYKITYVDANFEKISMFDYGMVGSKAIVYLGFLNNSEETITDSSGNSVLPNYPILSPLDVMTAYSGVVDTQGYTIDAKNGTVVAVIECSSPVASLGRINSFYTSKESMKKFNLTDNSFDEIYVGSKRIGRLWGKSP